MPEADFVIKQGDSDSPIVDVLRDENGDAVNILDAEVRFRMAPIQGGQPAIDEPASNDQQGDDRGRVSYHWRPAAGTVPGDTDVPGLYLGEWQVTYAEGGVQTFPNGGYIFVRITEAVA